MPSIATRTRRTRPVGSLTLIRPDPADRRVIEGDLWLQLSCGHGTTFAAVPGVEVYGVGLAERTVRVREAHYLRRAYLKHRLTYPTCTCAPLNFDLGMTDPLGYLSPDGREMDWRCQFPVRRGEGTQPCGNNPRNGRVLSSEAVGVGVAYQRHLIRFICTEHGDYTVTENSYQLPISVRVDADSTRYMGPPWTQYGTMTQMREVLTTVESFISWACPVCASTPQTSYLVPSQMQEGQEWEVISLECQNGHTYNAEWPDTAPTSATRAYGPMVRAIDGVMSAFGSERTLISVCQSAFSMSEAQRQREQPTEAFVSHFRCRICHTMPVEGRVEHWPDLDDEDQRVILKFRCRRGAWYQRIASRGNHDMRFFSDAVRLAVRLGREARERDAADEERAERSEQQVISRARRSRARGNPTYTAARALPGAMVVRCRSCRSILVWVWDSDREGRWLDRHGTRHSHVQTEPSLSRIVNGRAARVRGEILAAVRGADRSRMLEARRQEQRRAERPPLRFTLSVGEGEPLDPGRDAHTIGQEHLRQYQDYITLHQRARAEMRREAAGQESPAPDPDPDPGSSPAPSITFDPDDRAAWERAMQSLNEHVDRAIIGGAVPSTRIIESMNVTSFGDSYRRMAPLFEATPPQEEG